MLSLAWSCMCCGMIVRSGCMAGGFEDFDYRVAWYVGTWASQVLGWEGGKMLRVCKE